MVVVVVDAAEEAAGISCDIDSNVTSHSLLCCAMSYNHIQGSQSVLDP